MGGKEKMRGLLLQRGKLGGKTNRGRNHKKEHRQTLSGLSAGKTKEKRRPPKVKKRGKEDR